MATIVDSLVIELGLDPSKFTRAQKDAVESFKKYNDELLKRGKLVEEQGKRLLETYSKVRTQILGVIAAFTAGMGISKFIDYNSKLTASIGRLSGVVHLSTEYLSAWSNIAVLTGQSAEGAQEAILGFTQDMERFSITGESKLIPFLRALNITPFDPLTGKWKDMNEILLQISDSFSKMDPARAMFFAQGMGLGGLFNVLRQGRPAVEKFLADQKKLGEVTKADADAGTEFQKSWGEVAQASASAGREIFTTLAPALIAVLNAVRDLFEVLLPHKELLTAVFVGLATAATLLLSPVGRLVTLIPILATALGLVSAPATAIIASIALLTAGATELYENWDRIGKWWHGLWGGMAKDVKPLSKKTVTQSTSDVEAFQKLGWTREQAIGLAANIQRESGGNPSAVGDHGAAFGLAQWHAPRQAAFAKWAGHPIQQSTREEQIAFIDYELRKGGAQERQAGRALSGTSDAQQAARIVSQLYERPGAALAEANTRANIAAALASSQAKIGGLGAVPGAISGGGSRISNSSKETNIGTINVNAPQAKDADGIAKGIAPALDRNLFAQQANNGQQ